MGKTNKVFKNFINNIKAETLSNNKLGELLFGQQHFGLQPFFSDHYGQSHTVPLKQLPHYCFLENGLSDRHNPENIYAKYLKASWDYYYGDQNSNERRTKKINDFAALYDTIAASKELNSKAIKTPVTLCKRPDGKTIIVHGNHRLAIAYKLGLDIRAIYIPASKHLRKVSLVKEEFYGSAHLKMPYQSIFYGQKELVKGRRPDILERINIMDKSDIEGQCIMDLGCNIGNNCFMAVQAGAARAIGVDYSPRLISAAMRLNSYFSWPCEFIVHDLNHELTNVEPADTVFCFSVVKHLQNCSDIYKTILNKTKKVLYYEGHAHGTQSDYEELLNKDNFTSIDIVGYTRNGIHNKKKNRPLFRCEIKR